VLKRKPASECRLTEQRHGARVLVAGGDFAYRCQCRHVPGPFAKLGEALPAVAPSSVGSSFCGSCGPSSPSLRQAPEKSGIFR
jgi:hypothetical protein